MNLTDQLGDGSERSVSPVIGVILMVAITVILAAIIGAFVLSLGDQVSNSPPQAAFDWEFSNNNASITHGGGETVDNSTVEITIEGNIAYPNSDSITAYRSTDWGDPISTGDEVILYHGTTAGDPLTDGGDTIRIVWNNPGGSSSNILSERTYPN